MGAGGQLGSFMVGAPGGRFSVLLDLKGRSQSSRSNEIQRPSPSPSPSRSLGRSPSPCRANPNPAMPDKYDAPFSTEEYEAKNGKLEEESGNEAHAHAEHAGKKGAE